MGRSAFHAEEFFFRDFSFKPGLEKSAHGEVAKRGPWLWRPSGLTTWTTGAGHGLHCSGAAAAPYPMPPSGSPGGEPISSPKPRAELCDLAAGWDLTAWFEAIAVEDELLGVKGAASHGLSSPSSVPSFRRHSAVMVHNSSS